MSSDVKSIISNVCDEIKVPLITLDKQKDRISFLTTCISLNNHTILNQENRLSLTECGMVAHMINFCIENNIRDGVIEGKLIYTKFLDTVIEKSGISKNSFPEYRKNLKRKGVILDTYGTYKIHIFPFLIKILWRGTLNVLITSEKFKANE